MTTFILQVKSGTIFDNMMITDDPAEAKAAGEALWAVTKEAEKKMKDAQDEEERAKAEAEAGEKGDDEDDEDLDDLDEDEEDEVKDGDDEDAEVSDIYKPEYSNHFNMMSLQGHDEL